MTEAADGEAGIRLVDTLLPDIVVTDLFMPNQDGFDVLRAAQRLSKRPRVIVVTGGTSRLAKDDFVLFARHLGAEAVVTKPFSADDLTAAFA